MARNLSLIPTLEAESDAPPPAPSPRAAPVRVPAYEEARALAVVPGRRPRAPARAPAPRHSSREIAIEAVKYAGILLLFVALAWPLYVWIGR